MKNTRFYPTLNGACHLGHLLVALVNAKRAEDLGGVFIVRPEVRLQYLSPMTTMGGLEGWYLSYKQAFELAGIKAEFMDVLHDGDWLDGEMTARHSVHAGDVSNNLYPVRVDSNQPIHPYSPAWCLERVLLDNRYSIADVIRGGDLISEFSLYVHFCKQLGFPVPQMTFLPLVRIKDAGGIKHISKTNKNGLVSDLISKGISKYQLLDLVSAQCLKNPKDGFLVQNLKENPVFDLNST